MSLSSQYESQGQRGALDNATHVGTSGIPGEGEYIRIYLLVEDEKIVEASYTAPGCPSSIITASTMVRLLKGRQILDALKLDSQDLLLILGGLPEGRGHIAGMCVEALRNAFKEKI